MSSTRFDPDGDYSYISRNYQQGAFEFSSETDPALRPRAKTSRRTKTEVRQVEETAQRQAEGPVMGVAADLTVEEGARQLTWLRAARANTEAAQATAEVARRADERELEAEFGLDPERPF